MYFIHLNTQSTYSSAHSVSNKYIVIIFLPDNFNCYPVLIGVKPAESYNKVFTNVFVISACDAISNWVQSIRTLKPFLICFVDFLFSLWESSGLIQNTQTAQGTQRQGTWTCILLTLLISCNESWLTHITLGRHAKHWLCVWEIVCYYQMKVYFLSCWWPSLTKCSQLHQRLLWVCQKQPHMYVSQKLHLNQHLLLFFYEQWVKWLYVIWKMLFLLMTPHTRIILLCSSAVLHLLVSFRTLFWLYGPQL